MIRGAALGRFLPALMLAGLGFGCVHSPRDEPETAGAAGAWDLSAARCDQRLVLDGAGSFQLSAAATLAGLSHVEAVAGQVTPAQALFATPSAVRFIPGAAPPAAAALYCFPWSRASEWTLPLDSAAAALGADPRSLLYTPQAVPGMGIAWIGTDTAGRKDRMAFYRTASDRMVAWKLADPGFPNGLYRARSEDPLPAGLPNQDRLVTVPGGRAGYSGVAPGSTIKIRLNVRAAVEVKFSGTCIFALFHDLDRTEPAPISPLPPVLDFDPLQNPAWPYVMWPSLQAGGEPARIVPVAISHPSANPSALPCDARIATRAVSERVAAGLAADPARAPLFSATVPPGQAYLAGERAEQPGRLALIALSGAVPLGEYRVTSSMLVLPRPGDFDAAGDLLDLFQTRGTGTLLGSGGAAGGRWLNIYPNGNAAAGWGPFREAPRRPVALAWPFTLPLAVGAGAGPQAVAIRLDGPAQVILSTNGGVRTRGRLRDDSGRLLAFSVAGAADGAGFRIERDLAAGSYQVEVQAAPGSFTLDGVLGAGASPRDEALRDCLVESGAALAPSIPLRRAWCARRGILRLDDLAPFTTLEALDLNDNGALDLATLPAGLPALAVLSLAGNAIQDPGPLAGRASLRELSLARNPLAGSSVAVLLGMKDHLRLLDLTGVSTLSASDLETLRSGLPDTVFVPPSGQP